jgi:fatty-acyl-CoA synthase
VNQPDTLLRRIEAAATGDGTLTLLGSAAGPGADVQPNGDAILRLPWRDLHADALGVAGALQTRGVRAGDHVALLGPTSRALVTALQAVYLCGAAAVVLPLPMRLGSLEHFVAQTEARVDQSAARLVLVDADLADFVPPRAGTAPVVTLADLVPTEGYRRPADDADALAILQYTSGSTADPKGVMLPHRCVLANVDAMRQAADFRTDDVMVSWLPLYHDMGLIGFCTLPMATGTDLVLGAPQDFLGAPARWVTWMSEHRGTITAGPNFAYALAARALRRLENLDLSPWRIALNGAEPVDPDTVDAFVSAGARHGLSPGVVFGAYGMAEATLAITFPEPGSGMTFDHVDRRLLERERYAAPVHPGTPSTAERPVRRLPRLGTPIPGFDLRVCDPDTGLELDEREVGEIELRGPSITPGYWDRPDATAEVFRGEWLRTGDLGYWADGEVVVCGRIKDVIIVGGRNVFPEDVERAVVDVEGVRTGNVIAFSADGRHGKEGLVVVAEVRSGAAHADDTGFIRDQVHKRVVDAVGIPPRDIVLVGAGSLPKTSSGKLQRALCRTQFLEGTLQTV